MVQDTLSPPQPLPSPHRGVSSELCVRNPKSDDNGLFPLGQTTGKFSDSSIGPNIEGWWELTSSQLALATLKFWIMPYQRQLRNRQENNWEDPADVSSQGMTRGSRTDN